MVIKLNDLKTGMKVQTSDGKFYYVIEDWAYTDPSFSGAKCNAMLMACDPTDTQRFYGLLNYDEDGKIFGLEADENNGWNIEKVFIFNSEDLNELNNPNAQDKWVEVTEAIQFDQAALTRYFNKF